MGSCASVHKQSDSHMKVGFSIVSKTKKLLIPSPTKPKTFNGDHQINDSGLDSHSSTPTLVKTLPDYGSKEETFFDSQPWLDSDCEDFYSVNGDFSSSRGSSRGSTPIHLSSFTATPQSSIYNNALFVEREPSSEPEPSPTGKKKKLSELLRESFDASELSLNLAGTHNMVNGNAEGESIDNLPSKSLNGTPFLSGTNSFSSSQRTPNRTPKPEKHKLRSTVERCLPNFIPSCSSNERKKKSMSPIQNGEIIRT